MKKNSFKKIKKLANQIKKLGFRKEAQQILKIAELLTFDKIVAELEWQGYNIKGIESSVKDM